MEIANMENNVQKILMQYKIPDFINLKDTSPERLSVFSEQLASHVAERRSVGLPVDLDCLVSLLCELYSDSQYGSVADSLISCLPNCKGNGKSLSRLFGLIRNGIVAASPSDKMKFPSELIPISFHRNLLQAITNLVRSTEPPYISLPGDKDSYLQVSAVPLPPSKCFSMSMWMKLSGGAHSKGFLLYRYRSSNAGVDAIVSACTQESDPDMWNLTLRSNCDKKGVRDEVQCRMKITTGEWHLITVKQTAMKEGADSVSVAIDGKSTLEAELLYPFNTIVTDSIWIFGLGLKGFLTAITLYAVDLPPPIVELLHSFGPHVSNLTVGARCPQSSFDTGHLILGTICAKGSMAARLCQYTPVFCITANKLTSDARTPLVTPGVLYSDHIDLQPRSAEHDELLFCTLTGTSSVRSLDSGMDIWQDAGGCSMVMYLFWAYCDIKHPAGSILPASASTVVVGGEAAASPTDLLDDLTLSDSAAEPAETLFDQARDGISATLTLLAQLISSSTDFKEQFVQCHGFHVMGYCLSMQADAVKKVLIDDKLIDLCFGVVQALGPDATRGDGISAAIQGLLFDFRIWGCCELPALRHYLQALSSHLLELGSLVYKCVGIQRILDIFRLHIARKLSGAVGPATSSAAEKKSTLNVMEECALECADSVHRLLIISMDAAQSFAVRNKVSMAPDAEVLLRCLEETNSVIIAERILRIIGNLRLSAASSLRTAFHSVRFCETAIIPLITKKGFSLEVRSGALCNLFWMWVEEVKNLPGLIIPLRKALNHAISSQTPGPSVSSHRKSVVVADAQRIIDQLNDCVKPLDRCWVNLSMIGEVLRAAMIDGSWGKMPPSIFIDPPGNGKTSVVSNTDLLEYMAPNASTTTAVPPQPPSPTTDVSALIRVIMHSGQFDSWMQLPLLPSLLARSDLNTFCTMMMSMNVLFKTDDNQSEALSCIPTKAWLKMFISLAIMGEKAALHCEHQVGLDAAAMAANESDSTVAATCTELALDCVSIVLEYKTRTQLQDNNSLWQIFQNVIHNACIVSFGETQLAEDTEMGFLRRIVSLLLHRIANTGETWTHNLVTRAIHIFDMVESRKLFGASDANNVPSAEKPEDCANLLNFDGDEDVLTPSSSTVVPSEAELQRRKNKSIQETNIICFIFDISSSLRKAADRGGLHGYEWRALKTALGITLSVLDSASERVADRIMQDILAQLRYMSEKWAPITGEKFKSILMSILTSLRDTVNNPKTPEYLRGRYSALVFGIMHSFIEIRHVVANGGVISEHVLPTLEALMGIDSCNDISLIFKLLDVTMRKADAISFEEVEISTDDSAQAESITSSESYIALHKEKFTPDDEKLVKITPDSDNNGGYGDLPTESGAELSEAPFISLMDEATTSEATDEVKYPPSSTTVSAVPAASSAPTLASSAATAAATGEASSINTKTAPIARTNTSRFSTYGALSEATNREAHFQQWLKVRQGISTERVDSERARLARSMDTLDLTSEATKKFWKKARRKVESESFRQAHTCQWKLGVAHEGPFFGRRRVVLRPRFDSHYGHVVDHSKMETEFTTAQASSETLPADQLNRALAKACAGYIKDVTRSEAGDVASTDEKESKTASMSGSAGGAIGGAPGTGWGLVDVDGSEEGGFGVVGIASGAEGQDKSNETSVGESLSLPQDDMQGDVRQLEENFKQGKGSETGPCHSGTRRVGSGPASLDARVILITASGNFRGSLSFNGKEIFFASTFEAEDGSTADSAAVNLVKLRRMRRRRWVLSSVAGIYLRRFRLRDSAMEVFFRKGKHRNFFVDFGHTKEDARQRNEFARALMTAAPHSAFKQVPTMSAQRLVYEHKVQEKWLDGKMSNFDYLMALNTLAGRSYNDLCQYPVFPWVICDYTSSSIDLSDEKVYRDLSKPMGALNENRLREFMDRFNTFEENVTSGIPAFMYGSHYSTMVGVVLHFLVRLQPFAALHKEMQNGHFDVPDRLFSSIPRSFKHNTTQLSEVKELIPEWFTTPDMFRNVNSFTLGQTQDGDMVDDVELPPWASSPEEFVRINRAALESDYVSAHLHEWIDLIFGYKQRGPDAVEAHNVFYYLTYYGSVNHYMITDEALRRATELQIAHFGQTPMQLFRVPHPAKRTASTLCGAGIPRPLRKCFGPSTSFPGRLSATPRSLTEDVRTVLIPKSDYDEELLACLAPCTLIQKPPPSRILLAEVLVDRLLCVLENGVLEVLKYGTSDAAKGTLAYAASIPKARRKQQVQSKKISIKDQQASSSVPPADETSLGDLIVLDDLLDPFAEMQREQEQRDLAAAVASNESMGGEVKMPAVSEPGSAEDAHSRRLLLQRPECLIAVERELAHFDIIPRVPLVKPYKSQWKEAFRRLRGVSELLSAGGTADILAVPPLEQTILSTIFSRSSGLLICAGHVDGRVAVRELDTRNGFVKAAADFTGHRRRVVSLSSDSIPSGTTDVMATCDEAGIIMVWTILRATNPSQLGGIGYVISRRPQRLFRCDPEPDMFCQLSWRLGVVAVVSGAKVSVYSIERDELVKSFLLETDEDPQAAKKAHHNDTVIPNTTTESADSSHIPSFSSCTGPEDQMFGATRAPTVSRGVTRRMVLCDLGMVIVHIEVPELTVDAGIRSAHLIVAMTVTGVRTGLMRCNSPVTFMSSPDRNEYLILGFADGTVSICCAASVLVLFTFQPHKTAVSYPLNSTTKDAARSDLKEANRRRTIASSSREEEHTAPAQQHQYQSHQQQLQQHHHYSGFDSSVPIEASAVISVSIGPNHSAPTVICVVTESGRMYLQPLPDFVRWERIRTPSALQQLANVPLQAVKGTILQAQNWTAETAGVFVQNARSLADDALGELRKMNKGKLAKGVASFFGMGKSGGSEK